MSVDTGCIPLIQSGNDQIKPVVQIVFMKKLPPNPSGSGGGTERHRIVISDGVNTQGAMLATQLNQLVSSNQIVENCLIKMDQFMVNKVNDKIIIIIVKAQIISGPIPVIGNVQVEGRTGGDSSSASVKPPPKQDVKPPPPALTHQPYNTNQYPAPPTNAYGSSGNAASQAVQRLDGGQQIYPISSLNPYINKWTIKARVTNKSNMKSWTNARGQGTLFSVDLLDQHGDEIKCTFFKEDAERYYPMLDVGRVYLFSQGSLKPANRQYSSLKAEYEITFNRQSTVVPLEDDSGIGQMRYAFVKIAQLPQIEPNSTIDVLGVVRDSGPHQKLVSQKLGGKELDKRDLTLVDDSNCEVRCTIWGDLAVAEDKGWDSRPVIAMKGVKVSDYNGRTLSTLSSSQIAVNPTIPEATALSQWWATAGANSPNSFTAVGTAGAGGGAAGSGGSLGEAASNLGTRTTIRAMREEQLGYKEKPDYISIKLTLQNVRSEPEPWYTACPAEGCNKKVTEGIEGGWMCEKCQNVHQTCTRRYIMSMTGADYTGQTYLSCFNDVGKEVLGGRSADELYELKMQDPTGYRDFFERARFDTYLARVRVKSEMYMDEQRVKSTVMSMQPLDYALESRALLDAIGKYD